MERGKTYLVAESSVEGTVDWVDGELVSVVVFVLNPDEWSAEDWYSGNLTCNCWSCPPWLVNVTSAHDASCNRTPGGNGIEWRTIMSRRISFSNWRFWSSSSTVIKWYNRWSSSSSRRQWSSFFSRCFLELLAMPWHPLAGLTYFWARLTCSRRLS